MQLANLQRPDRTGALLALLSEAYPDLLAQLSAPQTLRMWAMKDGTGPVRPLRVHGILAWPVAELRRVLGVS